MNQTRTDGSVVSWGSPFCGGDSTLVRAELQGVLSVAATHRAFAALRASVGGFFFDKKWRKGKVSRYFQDTGTQQESWDTGTQQKSVFLGVFKGFFFLVFCEKMTNRVNDWYPFPPIIILFSERWVYLQQ